VERDVKVQASNQPTVRLITQLHYFVDQRWENIQTQSVVWKTPYAGDFNEYCHLQRQRTNSNLRVNIGLRVPHNKLCADCRLLITCQCACICSRMWQQQQCSFQHFYTLEICFTGIHEQHNGTFHTALCSTFHEFFIDIPIRSNVSCYTLYIYFSKRYVCTIVNKSAITEVHKGCCQYLQLSRKSD